MIGVRIGNQHGIHVRLRQQLAIVLETSRHVPLIADSLHDLLADITQRRHRKLFRELMQAWQMQNLCCFATTDNTDANFCHWVINFVIG